MAGQDRSAWAALSPRRRAAVLSWLAFLVTWVITRAITIHGRATGSAVVTIAGHHIHHYLFGIILIAVVGAFALFVEPGRGVPYLGIGYGIGLALILDEYALLLNLQDVYWAKQGRLSVAVVVGVIAAGGACLAAVSVVHDLARRARSRAMARVGTKRSG
jgi:hypothetical protein